MGDRAMTWSLVVFVCLAISSASAADTPAGSTVQAAGKAKTSPKSVPSKPGLPGVTPSSKISVQTKELGKLREQMLSAYCESSHAELAPCKTYAFMKKMRETKGSADKTKLLAERQAQTKNMSTVEKNTTKQAYSTMYT